MLSSEEFYSLMYEGQEPGEFVVVWHKDTKRSIWLEEAGKVPQTAVTLKGDSYFGVGLRPDPHSIGDPDRDIAYKKGEACDIVAIPALFADIDIADDVHKKTNLPPNIDAAMELVAGHGYDPTFVIHSGYGLHCYWMFKELWRFDSDEERDFAAALSFRLQHTIRDRAHANNWTIDGTFNLDRILRIPGTLNCKNAHPIKVEILTRNTDRPVYNPEDLDVLLLPADSQIHATPRQPASTCQMASTEVKAKIGEIVIDPGANVPFNDMDTLREIFPEFMPTFKKERDEEFEKRAPHDSSPSTYDFALAMMGAQAGWTDQEIVNLMLMFRRENGLDLKLDNKQYYARTVIQAKARHAREEAARGYEEHKDLAGTPYAQPDTRTKMLKGIANEIQLGADLLQFVKIDGVEPAYDLVTNIGTVHLQSIDDLGSFTLFRKCVGKVINRWPQVQKGEWPMIVERLLSDGVRTDKTGNDESGTRINRMREWLKEYIETGCFHCDTIDHAATEGLPFLKDGAWHMSLERFFTWINRHKDKRITQTETINDIKRIDAENIQVTFKETSGSDKGKRKNRRFWRLPEDMTGMINPSIANLDAETETK